MNISWLYTSIIKFLLKWREIKYVYSRINRSIRLDVCAE